MMISRAQLRKISRHRLRDAEALLAGKRYDGAVYICGYSLELALKARICRTLRWAGFPQTRKEFEGLQSYKTHNLDILLKLTGRESHVKSKLFAEWSEASKWTPEVRYEPAGIVSRQDAQSMISATKVLVKGL